MLRSLRLLWQLRHPPRRTRPAGRPQSARPARPGLECLEDRCLPATFTVVNTLNSGAGSLRQAVLDANADATLDTIQFNIPGSGVHTIAATSALPAITNPVILDGTTEPSFFGRPVIELNGAGAGAGVTGLTITGGGCIVRGLQIDNFTGDGIALTTNGGNTIETSYVGTANGGNGIRIASGGNTVGGTLAGTGNVISGNAGNGIVFTGPAATGNTVIGNYIGTQPNGTTSLPNGLAGVRIENGASNNVIGGDLAAQAPTAPVAADLALWLNADQGVTANAAGQVTAWADQSGHDFNGTAQGGGITLVANGLKSHNVVRFAGGGDLLLAGQVLTSQQYTVLAVVTDRHTGTTFHEVFSNWDATNGVTSVFLGTTGNNPVRARFTDAVGGATDPSHTQTGVGTITEPAQGFILTGRSGLANATVYQNHLLIADKGGPIPTRNLSTRYFVGDQGSLRGEYWQGDIAELLVYNTALSKAQLNQNWTYLEAKYLPLPANVISGNQGNGVDIVGGGTAGNVVRGNCIGTNANGTAPLPNAGDGVCLHAGAGTTIVGPGNLIAGNGRDGVRLINPGTSGNVIQGNRIGIGIGITDPIPLGNGGSGIHFDGCTGNVVGGTTPGAGNVIAYNNGPGVLVAGGTSAGNAVRQNVIFGNTGLPIDTGGNALQSPPVLTAASAANGTTTVTGSLAGAPSGTFALDFYSSATADPGTFGVSLAYVTTTVVTTDAGGTANFTADLPTAVPLGLFITATATALSTNTTSPFAQAVSVAVPPPPAEVQFGAGAFSVSENGGSGVVTVTRGGNTAVAVTVQYATADGSAIAPGKYGAVAGTLTFGPGEQFKTFTVPVVDDAVVEGDGTVRLTLSQPSAGAELAAPAEAVLTIADDELPHVPDAPPPTKLRDAAFLFALSREHFLDFVTKAYDRFLKRSPDPVGLDYWVAEMLAGRVSDERLEAEFLNSVEYVGSKGGYGRGWIVGMYQDLLGRTPAEDEVQLWLRTLAGGVSVAEAAFGFAASPEREAIRVRSNYRIYLGRDAAPAEVDLWVGLFKQGVTNEQMVGGFVGSPEYYGSALKGHGNPAQWVAKAYVDVLFRTASRDEITLWLHFLGQG